MVGKVRSAKGFVFISLEDETGVANAIFTPNVFEVRRLVITHERFLSIRGGVQGSHVVVLVKALRVDALDF